MIEDSCIAIRLSLGQDRIDVCGCHRQIAHNQSVGKLSDDAGREKARSHPAVGEASQRQGKDGIEER